LPFVSLLFLLSCSRALPVLHSFPTRRSSDLQYLILEPSAALREVQRETLEALPAALRAKVRWLDAPPEKTFEGVILANEVIDALDRKSTRLNSSHVSISYAVFCLKKKRSVGF